MALNSSQSQLRHNFTLRVSMEVFESRIFPFMYKLLTLVLLITNITVKAKVCVCVCVCVCVPTALMLYTLIERVLDLVGEV